MSQNHPNVSPFAEVNWPNLLSTTTSVGNGSKIFGLVATEEGVVIGRSTQIAGPAFIGEGVRIGPKVRIDEGAMILEGARICPDDVSSRSSDARTLGPNVSVGPCVSLHNEAELGPRAIVPTQRTVACIGNFGTKNRVVTVYGSLDGPRYSIGCQIGVSLHEIEDNVNDSTNTSAQSAATYLPYLPVFRSIGSNVQQAFDREQPLVDEMIARRTELGFG